MTTKNPRFVRDWREASRTDHRFTNDEIVRIFGNGINTPDTNAATYFLISEVDNENWNADHNPINKKDYFLNLKGYNSGTWNREWENGEYETIRGKLHVLSALSGQLELARHQKNRAEKQLLALNLGAFGKPMQNIIFALCSYVVHGDPNSRRNTHPSVPSKHEDPEKQRDRLFVKVQRGFEETTGLTDSELHSVYSKVAYQLTDWPERPRTNAAKQRRRPDGQPVKYDNFGISELRTIQIDDSREDTSKTAKC